MTNHFSESSLLQCATDRLNRQERTDLDPRLAKFLADLLLYESGTPTERRAIALEIARIILEPPFIPDDHPADNAVNGVWVVYDWDQGGPYEVSQHAYRATAEKKADSLHIVAWWPAGWTFDQVVHRDEQTYGSPGYKEWCEQQATGTMIFCERELGHRGFHESKGRRWRHES